MPDENKMLVYSEQDMQKIMSFLNSLTITGVEASRRLSIVATIIESGKPLEEHEKKEGGADGTVREELQSDNMEG